MDGHPNAEFQSNNITAGIPAFTEVSSPELQDLLTKVRERIFLPAHVSEGQRDLIFKPKHQKSLEVEPVTATIAGEEFTLKHLDVVTDVPNRVKSLNEAVKLMKEKRDWDNLPNLLQGLKTAGFGLESRRYGSRKSGSLVESLLRKAGMAGRQDVILECLRRADETGLTLTKESTVSQVFYQIQQKALVSDWDAEETKKALHWAEMVREMMEDPKHRTPAGSQSLAEMPEVTGTLLELAAVRAVKHQNGKGADGKVEKYALDLLAGPRDFDVGEKSSDDLNFWLCANLRIAHGIKLGQKVLDSTSEVSTKLKEVSAVLEPLLLAARDQLSEARTKNGSTLMGVKMYEKLLGAGAS